MLARAEVAVMARQRQQIAKVQVARRQRERRLEAPPVLLQLPELRAAVLQAEMQPAQERIQRAVDREVALVLNPTLARQLREELGLGPPEILVQELLPATIPTTPVESGPAPGARTGPTTTTRS